MTRSAVRVRLGVVYGIKVLHPVTGVECLGYVGQTGMWLHGSADQMTAGELQMQAYAAAQRRLAQHRADQVWADTIVGAAHVIDTVWVQAELDALELAVIGQLRPLYNVDGNRSNMDRIPPWTAKQQAQVRHANQPGWVKPAVPAQRTTTSPARPPAAAPTVKRSPAGAWLAKWVGRAAWVTAAWLVLACGAGFLVTGDLTLTDRIRFGAVLATVVIGVALVWRPKRRRPSTRTRRR